MKRTPVLKKSTFIIVISSTYVFYRKTIPLTTPVQSSEITNDKECQIETVVCKAMPIKKSVPRLKHEKLMPLQNMDHACKLGNQNACRQYQRIKQ
jgi:hypothetical protein